MYARIICAGFVEGGGGWKQLILILVPIYINDRCAEKIKGCSNMLPTLQFYVSIGQAVLAGAVSIL